MSARVPGQVRTSAKKRSTATSKRRRDPVWAQVVVFIGALLMMASGGAIVGGNMLISAATSPIDQQDMLGNAAAKSDGDQIEGPLNILLVGIDERPDSDEPTRSDSIIILHVPETHDQAFMISVPRDLYVKIPANKKLHPNTEQAKINAAFSYGHSKEGRAGGFALLAETINGFTGIKFDAGAIVNFGGFQKVVDALGGVDMCLDQATPSIHVGIDRSGKRVPLYKNPRAKPVHYEKGCRHLEGWEALDYVRQRKHFPNGDYDRARHQQQFLKAVMKRAKEQGLTSSPTKALEVMKAAGSALTVSANGHDLVDWALTLRNVTDSEVVMLKTNAGKYSPVGDGGTGEELSDASREMFAALRENRLGEFAINHSDFIASDIVS